MKRNFPFATHGRTDWHAQHPYCDFDNSAFATMAVTELAQRGRRNILLVLPKLAQFYAQETRDAALATARNVGMEATVLTTVSTDDPSSKIESAAGAFMQDHPEIDAVLCLSTTGCMAVTVAVEALGRQLGKDIDVAAKEAIPFLKQFRQPILTVFEDVSVAGDFVARATMQRIADPSAPPMQRLEVPQGIG